MNKRMSLAFRLVVQSFRMMFHIDSHFTSFHIASTAGPEVDSLTQLVDSLTAMAPCDHCFAVFESFFHLLHCAATSSRPRLATACLGRSLDS